MSFALPTLADLLDRTRKAFRTALPGTDAFLWPNNISPSAKVIAGAVFEVFGFAGYIAKMIFVSTAPDLETLVKHGAEYGIALRPADAARGMVAVSAGGTDVTVIAGAVLRRSDGVEYIATGAAQIAAGGSAAVAIVAALAGANGNAIAGTSLAAASGITGDASAEVSQDVAGGADVEDMESFRARILFRKRNPPHGGAAADYVQWATSVSGVTRVYVERRWAGPGSVRVFVLMDDLYPNGIAPTGEVERVADYIATVEPAGADVTVAAPTSVPVNIQIGGLSPDRTDVREAVLAELRSAFRRLSRVSGSDGSFSAMPFLASPASFSRSWLWQAVANAAGEERHTIISPSADVALTPGQIATLGSVTFT